MPANRRSLTLRNDAIAAKDEKRTQGCFVVQEVVSLKTGYEDTGCGDTGRRRSAHGP